MNNDPEKHDDEQTSTGDEISEDALGDTYLGKNLGHLIREIGRQHKKVLEETAGDGVAGSGIKDSDTADRLERLNEALDVVAANKENNQPALAFSDPPQREEKPTSPLSAKTSPGASSAQRRAGDAISIALSEIEATLQRFAEAERRRYDQEISGWRTQFRKAAMVVIKKQVETARANWVKKSSENEAKVAEHYKKLMVLADKVAKQKVEIQNAKQELQEKLELADRLHVEFDSIRQVLDGKLGVLDELDKDDEQG
ncbi:MAG: hypothetical protein OER43_01665 [Gammaproteobacteria bacterium]|nr:hypothetical protein [Gammaproteobacteria bacterium]MDH3411719.1 hypothetical protein [Gammaproteobacteria bacterium]